MTTETRLGILGKGSFGFFGYFVCIGERILWISFLLFNIIHKFCSLAHGFSSIIGLPLHQSTGLPLVRRCSKGSLRGISSLDYS